MTLGAGAVAIRRLKLLSPPREFSLARVAEALREGTLSPLAIDDVREESLGFAHPFTGEPDLSDPQSLVFEGSLVFALRKDVKKIPGTLFRLQVRQALEALQNAAPSKSREARKGARDAGDVGDVAESPRRRLTKAVREQAKERIKAELLKRTLPSIRLTEIVWHLDAGEIWILSTSQGVLEDFERLFFELFQTGFVQVGPGTAAIDFDRLHQGLPVTLDPLLELVPVGFVGSPDTAQALSAGAIEAGAGASASRARSGTDADDRPFF